MTSLVDIDFLHPWVLALLPLVLLPWLSRRQDALPFSSLQLLPADPIGRWFDRLWYLLASVLMALLVLGLASPGMSSREVERIGRGAEISILLDRSASMDAKIRRKLPEAWEAARPSQVKSEVVRDALLDLLEERPGNRYALTLFNTVASRVSPFTDDTGIIRAGLEATGIGRGPSETNMGLALLSAIDSFRDRGYTGSRAILLVSDGGASLDPVVQQKIRQGLNALRISLYFIYIQSDPNSPDLERIGLQSDSTVEEVELHLFFRRLGVDYRVFQANDPESMAEAVKEIDARQNLPLRYRETLPRVDFKRHCFLLALLISLIIAISGLTRLEDWQ